MPVYQVTVRCEVQFDVWVEAKDEQEAHDAAMRDLSDSASDTFRVYPDDVDFAGMEVKRDDETPPNYVIVDGRLVRLDDEEEDEEEDEE